LGVFFFLFLFSSKLAEMTKKNCLGNVSLMGVDAQLKRLVVDPNSGMAKEKNKERKSIDNVGDL